MSPETPATARADLPVADRLERRRLGIFLLVAYGLATATAIAVAATGGLSGGAVIAPGVPLALVLVATAYTFSPAVGNVLARALTGEGSRGHMLSPRVRANLRAYAVAWLGTAALVVAGYALYLLVSPGAFRIPENPLLVLAAAVVLGPAINAVFAFGEEFGWRGYLLPKLMPLGRTRAVVLHGVVWGVWHWPVIALGYNYGLAYPYAPYAGLLAMVVATVALGTVFAWVTLLSGSVWPAAVGHGTLNAAGSSVFAFVATDPGGLVGPAPVMLPGMVAWLLVAAALLRFGTWSRLDRGDAGRP